MGIITRLAAFAMRQALAKSATQFADSIERYFTDPTKALPKAISQAAAQTWQLMELAVAGNNLSDKVQRLLVSGQMRGVLQPLRERVQCLGAAFCSNCLLELRTARGHGLLAVGTQQELVAAGRDMPVLAEPGVLIAQARQLVTQGAEELQTYPHLAQLLAITDGGEVLLVTAFGYFLRQEISHHPTLREEMQFSLLTQVVQGQTAGWEELHRLLADQGAELAAELTAISAGLSGLAQGQAEIMGLLHEALQRLPKSAQRGAVSPRLSSMLRSTDNMRLFNELERRVNSCPTAQRTPEMLDAVGRLAMAVGVFNVAGERFQQAANAANITGATAVQAEALYNRYRALLEQKEFTTALPILLDAAQLDAANFAPFPLRRYIPQRILGVGGFGVAFLCHDTYFKNKPVVIKTLHMEGLERDVSYVFSEAHILQGLNHHNIIKIIDVNYAVADTEQRPYLVMEHFDGISLGDYLTKHGCLTLAQLLDLAHPVAEALHAAHAQGVWHRDLKPDNLLVRVEADGKWAIKLIDFGLAMRSQVVKASVVAGATNNSMMGQSLGGTWLFSAPEQLGLQDKQIAVGPWSDVYAFGKTLAYALFLMTEPTIEEWEHLGLDNPLVKILNRCIHSTPQRRPQTFSEVLTGIEETNKFVQKVKEDALIQQRQQKAQQEEIDRKAQEEQQRQAAEAKRKQEEANAALKAQEEQQRQATEAKRKQEEADAARKAQEELQRLVAEVTRRLQEADAARKAQEEQHQEAEEERQRQVAEEQYKLGEKYYYGTGVPQNYTEAVKWYRNAAEQGNATGQARLGLMYEHGIGVPKDATEAVKWYRKAAKQGNAYGQVNLGFMYQNGTGVPKDATEAVKWYRKAAKQGNAYGQVNLGLMYQNGTGVPKDATEAVKWYRKAADQGNADGQVNLSYLYAYGDGSFANREEAIKWLQKAIVQREQVTSLLGTIGSIWLKLGEMDKAKNAYIDGIAKTPDDIDLITNDLELAFVTKDTERFQTRLTSALSLIKPDHPEYAIVQFYAWLANPSQGFTTLCDSISKTLKYDWDFSNTIPALVTQDSFIQKQALTFIDFFTQKIDKATLETRLRTLNR